MFSVAFSGPAGSGVNTSALIVAFAFSKFGYKILFDKEYQSIIKGGNNTAIVYTDKESVFLSNSIDIFVYFDDYALEKNEKVFQIKNKIFLSAEKNINLNIFAAGVIFYNLKVPFSVAKKIVEEYFSYKKLSQEILEKNITSLKLAYEREKKLELNFQIEIDNNFQPVLRDGNKTVAEGALTGGLEFYSAYPMTPASSLIKYLSSKVTFFQGEDEIAVSMSMLGARFAGKRAMCGTSGGGFSLMSESISFANQAEIGGVYILSQRAGPSTGTPTFVEQGDILFALTPTFGDTFPIVMYPYDFENAYFLIQKALIWGDIYQHPIVFLLDKQFSESYKNIEMDKLKKVEEPENLNFIKFNQNFKEKFGQIDAIKDNRFLRYKITETGISSYTYPGIKNGEFIASSYEHTQSGATTEDPDYKVKMTRKRHLKLQQIWKNEDDFTGFKIFNKKAKKFLVTVGLSSITCMEFIKKYPGWGLIILTVLNPINPSLKSFIDKNVDELVFVELNYSGQLQSYLSCKLGLNCEKWKGKIRSVRKYNNYPLFIEDLENEVLG